jgi:hypothetical protein
MKIWLKAWRNRDGKVILYINNDRLRRRYK